MQSQGYRNFHQGVQLGQQQQFMNQGLMQQQTPQRQQGNQRRAVMPPNSQLNPAQEQQKIQLELAKRRSRKPTDKTIPEGVEEFIIGNGVANYKRLIEVERKLDSAAVRKRMDVQDSLGLGGNIKRFRTLRIWISNTVEDQEWQGGEATVDNFDFSMNRDASWKVKIEGRLLDDDEQDEDTESEDEEEGDKMEEDKKKSSEGEQRYKLFHFIKSLSVVFEPSRHHASISAPVVEWKKPILPASARGVSMPASASADFDSIEFKRGGDENQNITIKLVTDENPERFKLSPELTEVLDQEEATRGEAVTGVWEYIKIMGLQEDAEKRTFRCDELLKKIFQRDTFYIPSIADALLNHLKPLPPIELQYTIRTDAAFHNQPGGPQPTIYDIVIPLDSSLRLALSRFTSSPSYLPSLQQIAQLNDETAVIIQALQHSKAKHQLLTSVAKTPAETLKKWVSSQARDLEVIRGEGGRGGEIAVSGDEWRKGGDRGVWGGESVRESVALMLSRPTR